MDAYGKGINGQCSERLIFQFLLEGAIGGAFRLFSKMPSGLDEYMRELIRHKSWSA